MTVINRHHGNVPADAIHIGRPSRWGNPYIIGVHGDRGDVIKLHRRWLHQQVREGAVSLQDLAALHGKTLVCFCAPCDCHGYTLERAAAWAVEQLKQ
jgi:hypothetical protein